MSYNSIGQISSGYLRQRMFNRRWTNFIGINKFIIIDDSTNNYYIAENSNVKEYPVKDMFLKDMNLICSNNVTMFVRRVVLDNGFKVMAITVSNHPDNETFGDQNFRDNLDDYVLIKTGFDM